ncbi:hypothetical protein DRQ18_07965 [bacterium]|nr:MAG: hypothetical protein DRQ18_07965 [bacterium]
MKILTVEGKTREEALKKALEELGASEHEVRVKVVEEGEDRVVLEVGIKAEEVKLIKEVIEGFIKSMGTTGGVEVIEREGVYYANIVTGEMDSILIGKAGKNLEAVQHLLARMIHKRNPKIDVVIDIAGYREKRERFLRAKARAFAEEVKRTGIEYIFEPLPPSFRRVIHLELAGKEGVRTYTIGEGDLKKVVIAPKRRR